MDDDDDDPTMTAADRAVLHAAATGEDCIPIVSVTHLRRLAAAAQARKAYFDDAVAQMTPAQAAFVRVLRCERHCTWRAVAEACALEWSGDWGSNQLAGLAICERAAALHGEDPGAAPWN